MRIHSGQIGVSVATFIVTICAAVSAQDAPAHSFDGVESCGRSACHGRERIGDQMSAWQSAAHSRAYETLGTPEAQAIADERGVGPAQEAAECLRCHETAFGVDAAFLGEDFTPHRGVQCESCHGPGSDYSGMRVMRDHEASIAAGLIVPDEALCRGCHNDESPTFDGFDFAEASATIAHPIPEDTEEEEGGQDCAE